MQNRFAAPKIILGVLFSFACLSLALTTQAQQAPVTKTSAPASAPAPRHDLSGTWEPANGFGQGIQAQGVKAMPNLPDKVPMGRIS